MSISSSRCQRRGRRESASRTTWSRSSARRRSSISGPCGHSAIEFDVVVAEDHPLARRQAAQALVPCGRRQPGADAIRVLDTVDVLEQAEPGGLGDVGGVALRQLELHRNGPDEPGVLIDQALPCMPVPLRGAAHQARDIRGINAPLQHRRHYLLPNIETRTTDRSLHDSVRGRADRAAVIGLQICLHAKLTYGVKCRRHVVRRKPPLIGPRPA